jgi:hypothetical protein
MDTEDWDDDVSPRQALLLDDLSDGDEQAEEQQQRRTSRRHQQAGSGRGLPGTSLERLTAAALGAEVAGSRGPPYDYYQVGVSGCQAGGGPEVAQQWASCSTPAAQPPPLRVCLCVTVPRAPPAP